MVPLLWVGLLSGSLGAGAALGALLAVRRPLEPLVMIAGVASMVVSAASAMQLGGFYDQPAPSVISAVVALAGVVGGFALVSSLLPYVRPRTNVPRLPSLAGTADTLVLLLGDTEPPEYAPSDVTREIEELVDAGLPEPSIGITPFHYAAQKSRYRAVGGRSPEWARMVALAERIESLLDRAVFAGPVSVRAGERGSLAVTVRTAADAGYRRVVVAGAYIAEGIRAVEERNEPLAHPRDAGDMEVLATRTLWMSDVLSELVAEQVLSVSSNPAREGVALVVHGQPGEHAKTNPAFDVHENAFANRVRALVCDKGFAPEHVRVCSAEWSDPGVTEAVRHLGALGCERIAIASVCQPFANLQTLIDIPAAARDARLPESVTVVHTPPWGESETFASVLAEEIRRAVRE